MASSRSRKWKGGTRYIGGAVKLSPKQAAFRHGAARYRGFVGGIGSGKSWVGAYDLLRRAKPGCLYIAAAPTYPMLRDATFRTFRTIAEDLGFWGDYLKSEFLVELVTGAQVVFRSADDPDRLRGPNASGFWLDEAGIAKKEAFTVGIGRLRESEDAWFSATFTPNGRQHWTYEQFAPDLASGVTKPNTSLVISKTRENPFLPSDFEAITRSQYTSEHARQELDGEFLDPAGSLMRSSWFKLVSAPPAKFDRIVRFWDFAATEADLSTKNKPDGPDYTVGILMGRVGALYYVLDMQRVRASPQQVLQLVRWTAELDGVNIPVRVEEEPGSAGKSVVSMYIRELAGYDVKGEKPTGDKVTRANPFAAQAEAGNVLVVRNTTWNPAFLAECGAFPLAPHDDIVDASSGAFRYITAKKKFSIY